MNNARGFTLVDLIIVVAVLAVMASVALPILTVMEDRAREQRTAQEMRVLEGALVAYYRDYGAYPSALADLDTGGYLPGDIEGQAYDLDAWQAAYDFSVSGMTATLVSAGVDRQTSSGDDLTRNVSSVHVEREETRDEMLTIHIALRNYDLLGCLPDLPAHWDDLGGTDGAFRMLVDEGLLPDESRFLTDGWGSTYTYAGTPATCVDSPNVPSALTDCTGSGGGACGDTAWVAQDAWLEQAAPKVRHGTDTVLSNQSAAGDSMRAIVEFDLSAIPGGTTLATAEIWLYVTAADASPIHVHRVSKNWVENNVDWNKMGDRYDAAVRGSFSPAGAGWHSVDVTALVQEWVDGTQANDGVMLLSTSSGVPAGFVSREGSAGQRPHLILTYP